MFYQNTLGIKDRILMSQVFLFIGFIYPGFIVFSRQVLTSVCLSTDFSKKARY